MAEEPLERLLLPLLLVLLLLAKAAAGPRYSSRIVETQSGAIRGIILEPHSRHLEPVEAFLGVPYGYAERLRPPNPPTPWKGTRLADSFGPVCPQRYPDVSNKTAALMRMPLGRYQHLRKMSPLLMNQSEDCLYLNIYVPGSGNRGMEAPYAVLVWIHGDSYEWGSGNPYDGSVLAAHGHIIVLTLNFRLGLLGFLKTRPNNRPGSTGGNLALRDLACALRWARRNLQSFGGDPSRLTLLGHGVGAALANLLLFTTEAKDLFHRLVLLSGSALSPWALVHDPESLRSAVAEQLNCDQGDEDEDLEPCLRTKPLDTILDVRLEGAKFMSLWGPHNPAEPGLAEPLPLMESAGDSFVTCDLMLGVATTESYYDFSATDIQYGFEEDYRNRVLRTFVRNAYVYHLNEIYAAIRNEYTDWDKPIQHPINIRDSTMEALSDGHTAAPLLKVAHLHARRGATTYFFHFAYQTKESDYPQRLGSVRGEPVGYILGFPLVGGLPYFPANFSRQDAAVSEALLTMVVNFVKIGDPNGRRGDPAPPQYTDYGRERARYKDIAWAPYDVASQQYLSLATKPKMKSHYRGHKMALWLNLIPQLHQPGASDVSMRHHHFRERDPHFYTGPVRPESYTLMYTRAMMGLSGGRNDPTECEPSVEELGEGKEDEESIDGETAQPPEDEHDLLQRLTNKHFYSYTAALGVTVGIGCFLLVLNMVIFAGIYYQRGRGKKREPKKRRDDSAQSISDGLEKGQHMDDDGQELQTSLHELPPSYRTHKSSLHNQKSQDEGGCGGTLRPAKKRVQIQEISV